AINEFGFRFFLISAIHELKRYKLEVFKSEHVIINIPEQSREEQYQVWLHINNINSEKEKELKDQLKKIDLIPKLILIISINKENKQYLMESLNSIKNQIYSKVEIWLNVPTSITEEVNNILKKASSEEFKIQQRNYIQDILANAGGDFVMFMNSGDVLTKDASFRMIQFLNKFPDTDIIYSDEDRIDPNGIRSEPFFKPDWSPDTFLCLDYISNFYIVKQNLLGEYKIIDEYGNAKHYDLLLKISEKHKKIVHIPTILVSIRKINYLQSKDSFEEYGSIVISNALKRRNIDGKVDKGIIAHTFRPVYNLKNNPKVSIIIPTKDNKGLLVRCINSLKKTEYKNFEIIIIDNGSVKTETRSYLKSLPYLVLKYNSQFNFAKMNNVAASRATGDYLLFMNDDVAVLEPTWLTEMLSVCQLNEVGVVGPKLVYAHNTIQHAGISFLKTGAGFHPLTGVPSDSDAYFGFLNIIRNCSAVTGACLLIKKKLFEDVGGFDEKFDLYYNDADLCQKVASKGYKIVYTPFAKLLHQGASTIKEYSSSFFAVENWYHFIKKWPLLKNGDPFYNPNLGWDYKLELN
ncbi:MAG: glycosyltransferase family 2 protein, partial [Nitrosopumilaceae archaeon]